MSVVILWVLGVLLILVGLVGIVAPALPGPAFVYLGIVSIAWAHDFDLRVWWAGSPRLAELTALRLFAALERRIDSGKTPWLR